MFAFSPFTVWFNLTGQPAMMLPIGRSADGLPIAVQIVARYGDEATPFRLERGGAPVVRRQARARVVTVWVSSAA